jgi:m7GpppX diphosphatase
MLEEIGEIGIRKIMESFVIIEVLNNNNQDKSVDIRGFSSYLNKQIIISFFKTTFTHQKDKLQNMFLHKNIKQITNINNANSINFKLVHELNNIDTIDVEINTNTTKNTYCTKRKNTKIIVQETQYLYKNIIKPYVKNNLLIKNSWIYDILDGTKENENIIYKNNDPINGFVVLPDPKWDYYKNHLYLLVIVNNKNLYSLRELDNTSLQLLENIKSVCSNLINSGFNYKNNKIQLSKNKLRFFIHYVPSYWHLHIHIVSTDYGYKGMSINEAHNLDDIIHNIKLDSDYYKNKTMHIIESYKHCLIKEILKATKNK